MRLRPNCASATWLPFSPMADSAASMRSYPNDCAGSRCKRSERKSLRERAWGERVSVSHHSHAVVLGRCATVRRARWDSVDLSDQRHYLPVPQLHVGSIRWRAHRGSEGADAGPRKNRSGSNLYFHVESHLQSRSADHAAADSAPHFRPGEKRLVPRSSPWKHHSHTS